MDSAAQIGIDDVDIVLPLQLVLLPNWYYILCLNNVLFLRKFFAMHAYLIDPFARRITTVEYRGDQRKIHCCLDAIHIDMMLLNRAGDGMYIDDDGFAKDPTRQAYFLYWQADERIGAESHVVAGKALVVGALVGGMPTVPSTGIAELARRVVWIDAAHAVAIASRALRDNGRHVGRSG